MGNEKERDGVETMPDPESRLSRKRSQKEFEELLLKDILIEVEASKLDFWEQKAMELADQPGYAPTPKQRAAFEERLDLEVKRIQKQKRQFSQIAEPLEDAQALQDPQESQGYQNSQDSQYISNTQDHQDTPKTSDRRRKRQRILRKVGSIAAILVLFVFMTMYHTVEAFAAGVDRFITVMLPDDGAEELRVEDKKGAGVELNLADFAGMYFPEWIPRGYALSKVESYEDFVKFTYTNKNGDVIVYKIVESAHSVYVDDEDIIENKVYVLDTWARVVEMEDRSCLVWEDESYVYSVVGKVELKDELIKLVERCVKIEQEN